MELRLHRHNSLNPQSGCICVNSIFRSKQSSAEIVQTQTLLTPCTPKPDDAQRRPVKHHGSMIHLFLMVGHVKNKQQHKKKRDRQMSPQNMMRGDKEEKIKIAVCEVEMKVSGMPGTEKKKRRREGRGV